MTLRDTWAASAREWIAWARAPGHDSYWQFHRDRFLELVPPAGRLTLDLGCGEGRLARDLKARGHTVVGVDITAELVDAAREADPGGDYRVADAAAVPFDDAAFDLVVAFMSLQDMDDMEPAVHEAARVLAPGGRFCLAVVHPINSAGLFSSSEADSPFVIEGSYFEPYRIVERVERDGLPMTFAAQHRSLEDYLRPLESAGFLVEAVREIEDSTDPPGSRWRRIPLFLDVRAIKGAGVNGPA
jgi:SAM-dependent methyltransferase